MSKENDKLNTLNRRFVKLGNYHSRKIGDTRKAVLLMLKVLASHIPSDEQKQIKKLLGELV